MPLTEAEIARYARQLLLPAFGEAGQERLRDARVRLAGGGLASGPAGVYLAQAGVGTIWVDDIGMVAPKDRGGWIFPPDKDGALRSEAATEALRSANGLVRASLVKPREALTAVLVCSEGRDELRAIAEEARDDGLPHVVAEVHGDGGSVVVVPVGAPCYACSYRAAVPEPPTAAGAAAVGALAVLELVLLVSGAAQTPLHRRIDLVRGQPLTRTTARQPGCACAPTTASAPAGGA
jgi:molybdopterin-synthase adenylyltransferase